MDTVVMPGRPWTIKWAIGILIFMGITGDIYVISNGLWTAVALIVHIVGYAILFAIWQGSRWARNLLFFNLLFGLPLLIWLAGIWMINPEYHWRFSFQNVYALFGTVTVILSVWMMFLKPSNEWFSQMKGEMFHDDTQEFSWYFQLTMIVISIGLGFVVMTLNAMIIDLHTLEKQLMIQSSTYASRLTVLLSFESLDFLIGVIIVLFPFALMIGYWKQEKIFLLARLITFGAILPVLVFPVGETFFILSLFFFLKVLIMGMASYLGLLLGGQIARYISTLRVPIEIK